MQLVTLTAPDGHQERWDFKTTYLALLNWYQYLKDVDNAKEPNELGTRISKFVGDDIKKVYVLLTYLDGSTVIFIPCCRCYRTTAIKALFNCISS